MVKCRYKNPKWDAFVGRKNLIHTRCKICLGLPSYAIKKKEVAGCNADCHDGIPPNNKLLGILPTIL